jgi:hypothetical protein
MLEAVVAFASTQSYVFVSSLKSPLVVFKTFSLSIGLFNILNVLLELSLCA